MVSTTERWRSGFRRWTSAETADAQDLLDDSARAGCVAIAETVDREQATVRGTLRTVTLRPRGGVPALEAELFDGSGVLTLVWLGRRRIGGIEPGRPITVHGRIGQQLGQRIMFNPRYELGHP